MVAIDAFISISFPEGKEGADDKKKWKQMQVLMQDSVKFVEMLHHIDWENGLPPSVMTNLEYFLPRKDGEGVTGEGSLLDLPGMLVSFWSIFWCKK